MKAVIRHAFSLCVLITGLTGIAYPLITAGMGHTIFPLEWLDALFGETFLSELFSDGKYATPDPAWPLPDKTQAHSHASAML